jgi:tetratricopeptide (TPR) repeat protein
MDKALYVFDLNTKIFPYKYNVYDSLGEAYYKSENQSEALKNYYKVLSLKPDDKNALEMIEKINQI